MKYTADWLVGLYFMKLTDDLQTLNQGSYFDPFFDFAFDLDDSFLSRRVNKSRLGWLGSI